VLVIVTSALKTTSNPRVLSLRGQLHIGVVDGIHISIEQALLHNEYNHNQKQLFLSKIMTVISDSDIGASQDDELVIFGDI